MSWVPDIPIELPDGRLVCGTHGLRTLLYVQTNMKDDLDHAGSLDIERLDPIRHTEVSRGSGLVLPTVFKPPPSATPQSLFPASIGRNAHPHVTRFIRVDDPKSFLICTDGACLGNGQGPLGDFGNPTNNRAELRAIIGALRYRNWASEGFTTLVLATDSEYVLWKIPREWNTEADRLAKEGAQLDEELTFKERMGISP
ncbi:putative Signal recognition particle protein like protein [Fusarium oxysporum f. sp. albedinis]|nr:putative Signal recognition particle protein like protein [Fusarium oxysporum f. sp. albedinis]